MKTDHLENLDIDGRLILRRVLNQQKWDGVDWSNQAEIVISNNNLQTSSEVVKFLIVLNLVENLTRSATKRYSKKNCAQYCYLVTKVTTVTECRGEDILFQLYAVTHRPTELSTYCSQCVPATVDLGGNQHETRDDHSARCTIEIRSVPSLMSSWPDDIIQTIHCTPAIFGRDTTLSPTFAYLIKHVTTGIITNDAHSHSLLQNLRIQIRPYNVQIPVWTSKKTHFNKQSI
jgi:hypothetical protein